MNDLLRSLLKSALFLQLALVGQAPVLAQSLQGVVEAHVQALGGAPALRELKTLKMDASTRYLLFKLSLRSVIVNGEGVIRSAYSGRDKLFETVVTARGGHEVDEAGKRKGMDPREAAELFVEADLAGPFVDSEKKGISLQWLGQRTLKNGVNTYVIEVQRPGGQVARHFIRTDDHMVVRVEDKTFNAEKSRWEDDATDFDDYRNVAGVKLPFQMRSKDGETIVVNSYKVNEPVDLAVFK